MSVSDQLRALLKPVVTGMGLDLEDVEVRPAGRRSLVRVLVDKDGGVDLDAVAEASQAISDALDASEVMGEKPYTLEVSSPGVDRPLTEPRHWRRNKDRLVKVTKTPGGEATEKKAGKPITGRIKDVNEGNNTVTLDVDGNEEELALSEVQRAIVQVEFGRE